jgi:integrase
MVLHLNKPQVNTDNVITLSLVDGKLCKKPEVRYNKDGSVDKRHSNRVSGVSSIVYPFNVEEVKAMIDVLNKRIKEATNDNQRQIAQRNKMMFLIGVNVGLRASDLMQLRWSYFYKDDMTFKEFYVLQPKKTIKTGKFVKIFFNQTVKKAVENYVKDYPIEDLDNYLFKSRKGNNPITERGLWKIVVDAADDAGIEKNVGSHSLRKTWARTIYDRAEDKGDALVMLQECLRHSDSLTTLRYISIMDEEKKDMYKSIELGLDYI